MPRKLSPPRGLAADDAKDIVVGFWHGFILVLMSLSFVPPSQSQPRIPQQVEEDRYKELLDRSDSENIANAYFRCKRANQLRGGETATGHGEFFFIWDTVVLLIGYSNVPLIRVASHEE